MQADEDEVEALNKFNEKIKNFINNPNNIIFSQLNDAKIVYCSSQQLRRGCLGCPYLSGTCKWGVLTLAQVQRAMDRVDSHYPLTQVREYPDEFLAEMVLLAMRNLIEIGEL